MGPIFYENFVEKRSLWVLWTMHETHLEKMHVWEMRKMRFPNVHLVDKAYGPNSKSKLSL